jgi:hypothetical protein
MGPFTVIMTGFLSIGTWLNALSAVTTPGNAAKKFLLVVVCWFWLFLRTHQSYVIFEYDGEAWTMVDAKKLLAVSGSDGA